MVFYLFCNAVSFLTGFFIVFAVFCCFFVFPKFPPLGIPLWSRRCIPSCPVHEAFPFSKPLLKTSTNRSLEALRVYEAFSFEIPYYKPLQMCLSKLFASTRHFPFKFLIKNHYKCAPRSPSRLRGIFFLNPSLKISTNAPLGSLRV